jgi:hypothetical protein
MGPILRWFDYGGQRYRAYYRTNSASGGLMLVVAGPQGEHVVEEPPPLRLDELDEALLHNIAQRATSN